MSLTSLRISWRTSRSLLLRLLLVTLALGVSARDASAATLPAGFSETSIGGLSAPTAMAIAPDGRIFVCEKGGALRVIKNGALLPTPFVSLTVDAFSERGLLGVAFDPAFATNGFVYVYYTATGPIHNRVSRFTANGDVAVPASESVLLDLPAVGPGNHNGGAIHFGPDGKLYVAVGEHANPSNSQATSNPLGKILRINTNGSPAPGNPFAGVGGADARVWALGLRNPFTFAFNPANGQMFINDVGSGGSNVFEEINDGISGANYGWPTEEGIPSTPSAIFTRPRFAYDHSDGTCAITGGAFYSPAVSQFPGEYAGDYFFSDLCGGWIKRLDVGSNSVTDFATGIASAVDIQIGSDGSLYYLSINAGTVTRVQFTNPGGAPVDPALSLLTNGLSFQLSWTASAGATSYQLQAGSQRGAADLLDINVGTNRVLEGIVGAGTYYVRVLALGPGGTSGPSNEAEVRLTGTAACATPPAPPTGYAAQASGVNVQLAWNRTFSATSYVLEAGSISGGADVLIANVGNVTSLAATAPPNTYFTRIRAANACGVSAPSSEVPVVLACNVPPPTGLLATRTGAIVTFTWTGSPGATGYRAQVGSGPGQSNLLNVPLGTSTSVSIGTSGVAAGTYYVRMLATTSCGASGPSNEAIVTVP